MSRTSRTLALRPPATLNTVDRSTRHVAANTVAATASATKVKLRRWLPSPNTTTGSPVRTARSTRAISMSARCPGPYTVKYRSTTTSSEDPGRCAWATASCSAASFDTPYGDRGASESSSRDGRPGDGPYTLDEDATTSLGTPAFTQASANCCVPTMFAAE